MMMAGKVTKGLMVLVMIAGAASAAMADAEKEAADIYLQKPPAHFHEIDNDFMKAFHNPMDGLTMGLDLRLREVYARNIFSLNDSYGDSGIDGAGTNAGNWNNHHWQRYRTRWSTRWAIDEDIDFNTRLVWEFWGHCAPDGWHPIFGDIPFWSEKNYDFDEAIFDHFNIQMRNAFDMPLTLTVGRGDVMTSPGKM